jgi:hypothetical protein
MRRNLSCNSTWVEGRLPLFSMAEFPRKLSASGGDLGVVKVYLTIGFSGTNDLQPLLPLEVYYIEV